MLPTPREQAALVEQVEARRQAEGGLRFRIRMHLEKFDHLVDPPRLVEYQIRERGECVWLERWDAVKGRMVRLIPSEAA